MPELAGQEEPFPEPDNQSKMKRSCENAEHVGQYRIKPFLRMVLMEFARPLHSKCRAALQGRTKTQTIPV